MAQPNSEAVMPEEAPIATTVAVPIGDLVLWQAALYTTDGENFWRESMPAIVDRFAGVTFANYWDMTVADHAAFLEYLNGGHDGRS